MLSKRSIRDELKKSFEHIVRPDDDPEVAMHVMSTAAAGGALNRALPGEYGAA
jgi:hypothetical protein